MTVALEKEPTDLPAVVREQYAGVSVVRLQYVRFRCERFYYTTMILVGYLYCCRPAGGFDLSDICHAIDFSPFGIMPSALYFSFCIQFSRKWGEVGNSGSIHDRFVM